MSYRVEQTSIIESSPLQAAAVTRNQNPASIFDCVHINRNIENSRQGAIGDCWLLSSINSLRSTDWGREIIRDTIREDGCGGAYIYLKGSLGEQKVFHITVEDIIAANNSGKYSKGDDDVVALELAFEKYMKMYAYKHNRDNEAGIHGNGLGCSQIVEIMTGKSVPDNYYMPGICEPQYLFKYLTEISNNKGAYAVTVSFKETKDGVHSHHRYQLENIITKKGVKYAVLINPWDSSKKVEIPLKVLCSNLSLLEVVQNPNEKVSLKEKISDKNFVNNLLIYSKKNLNNMLNSKNSSLEPLFDVMAWVGILFDQEKDKKVIQDIMKPLVVKLYLRLKDDGIDEKTAKNFLDKGFYELSKHHLQEDKIMKIVYDMYNLILDKETPSLSP